MIRSMYYVLCSAAFEYCDFVRGSDGLYRCQYCGRLSLLSALRDANRDPEWIFERRSDEPKGTA